MPASVRKVLLLYVGGTIGMQKNDQGAYIPIPNAFLQKLTKEIHRPEVAKEYNIEMKKNQLILYQGRIIICEFKEYDPLLDSSNMTETDWSLIAKDIEQYYNEFDGFVVLHGTDTLCYTSSALSFMLEGLSKPVIVTGSQISFFEPRNDAKSNILSSIDIAVNYDIPEVCIFFADKLCRGNRTTKISSTQMNAFNSPNLPPLAEVGITVKVNSRAIRKPGKNLKVFRRLTSNVGVITIVPTINSAMLKAILQPPLEGAVLESFGVGNIPTRRQDILDALEEAIKRGVIIVNITQCSEGAVNALYEPGQLMENIGVISGNDMTLEAALTKLSYVLALPNLSRDDRIMLVRKDLRGELTAPDNNNNNNNNCAKVN
ncbi:unnamed protein product [Brassicogethes aeneus]|uniref:asparaginase n=1 Tax=Brassicogethes aeneus TaxID=1431903 RepID=A0A9P0B186_BRAAE|nr:unnamed protein product [Brassicogethes aeneus]